MESKGKTRGIRQFPIDFTAPIQLEEALHRIEHGASNRGLLFNIRPTEDSDRVQFTVYLYRGKAATVWANGILRRWQGTDTRLEGKAEFLSRSIRHRWGAALWAVVTIIYLIAAVVVNIALLDMLQSATPLGFWAWVLVWFLIYILLHALLINISLSLEQRRLVRLLHDLLADPSSAKG